MACPTIRNFILSVALIIVSSVGVEAETLELTLEELLIIGLGKSPQIEIARQQYLGSEGVLTQAKSGYLPHLSTGAQFGRMYIDELAPVDEDNLTTGYLRISQLIYDFGRTTGFIDASSYNRDAAAENFNEISQDVVFKIKRAFYQVLEKQRLIKVSEEAVANYEQQLYRTQKFYEAGIRAKIDVTNAEVNLSNQRLALLRAQSDLKIARTNLENVIGIKPNEGNYELVSNEPPLEKLAATKPKLPATLDDLLLVAHEERPGLARYELLVKAAESSLDRAEGGYWPVFDTGAEYQAYESELSALADQWQIQIGLTWEFFSGFETEGRVAESRAQLAEIEAVLREFELALAREVTDSYLRAQANRDGVDIADHSLAMAIENLKLADGRYKAGISDILEYNDAQLLYIENQTNLVITYYNYLTALADIERSIGMTPELIDYEPLKLRK